MIDRRKAWDDQRNLAALCTARRSKHAELYEPNGNYGFADVLKSYARYPADQPVWGVIPHGVYLDDEHLFAGEAQTPLRAVFSFPGYRDAVWEARSNKTVIPSAAPFLYALELLRQKGWTLPEKREGTIVFPLHSSAVVDTDTDWARLAEELVSLPEEYQPVTTCVHWQDLARGREREFAGRGLRMVSAGHYSDPEFMFRLIHLMADHRFAASNEVASNLFYAVSMGLPYFLVGGAPAMVPVAGHEDVTRRLSIGSPRAEARIASIRPMFERGPVAPAAAPSAEQAELAAFYLGAERLKGPEELRADLEFARSLHTGGVGEYRVAKERGRN